MKQTVKIIKTSDSDSNSTVALVLPSQLALVWGQVETWLEKGEKYTRGYFSNEDLYNAIAQGQMQLWVAYKQNLVRTIMLTQLDFYPQSVQFRYVLIVGAPGSFDEIIHD